MVFHHDDTTVRCNKVNQMTRNDRVWSVEEEEVNAVSPAIIADTVSKTRL